MAFPTAAVLDNFNRANGAIGSNWLAAFGDTIPAINTNAAKGGAGGWYGAVWAPSGSVASFGADCECYYTLSNADASSQSAMVLARVANPTSGTTYNGYSARIVAGQLQIGKFASAVYTALATGATITVAAGDKLGIECVGSSIRLYYAPAGVWPGTANITVTDATYSAAGAIAVDWNQTGANTNGMDDFGGGTIAGGTTQVAATRRVNYAVQKQVAATRRINYGVLAQVAATRRVAYGVLAAVIATRRVTYNVTANVAATRRVVYSVASGTTQVAGTRRVVYAVSAQISATRRVRYDVQAAVVAQRRVVYNVMTQAVATRRITYGVLANVAGTRRVSYFVGDAAASGGSVLALVGVGR